MPLVSAPSGTGGILGRPWLSADAVVEYEAKVANDAVSSKSRDNGGFIAAFLLLEIIPAAEGAK